MFRIALTVFVVVLSTATPALAVCETHREYTAEFRNSLNEALYRVRNQQHLAYIIERLIIIDRETAAHEEAHFNAARGWAEPPEYDTVELYGRQYRIGGCVRAKPGIPLEVAHQAALAPKDPSPHDLRLARKYMLEMQRLGMR